MQGWEVSGDPMSWTQLSHLRGSGLTPGRGTKTLTAAWLRRKGRKNKIRTDRTPNQVVKAKLNRQNYTNIHTYRKKKQTKNKEEKTKNKQTNKENQTEPSEKW